MLYEQWMANAESNRHRLALRSQEEGREWTFGQLADEAETLPRASQPVVFPSGRSSAFILETLRGWRDDCIVCPLEENVPRPDLSGLPAEIRHVKLTSGTTGTPRFVLFTASQIAADAENIVATMRLNPASPNLGVLSLAHSYGYSNLVLPLLLRGIPLSIAASPLPENVRVALSAGENWTVPAVPALWQAWLNAGIVCDGIRTAISAGAPLTIQVEHSVFGKYHLKIHNFLGSSECGGIAYDITEIPRTDASFVGIPLKNVSVSVIADGRLCVESPAVASTYWPTAEPNLRSGRFELSDLGEIRDGNIHLRGRSGDQINVAGRKVSPESIEWALLEYPGLEQCLVFGIPSALAERNEEIVALIVGPPEMNSALRQHASSLLPSWQIPRHWMFVESLQTNARGKVSRGEWRVRFLAEHRSS